MTVYLEVNGVAMVCISYLDIAGNPAHLRYLLQRVRQRVPNASLLVGLWPADEPVLRDQICATRSALTTTFNTLHEAVDSCLAAAVADGASTVLGSTHHA